MTSLEQRALTLASTVEVETLQELLLTELAAISGARSAILWVAGERTVLRLRAWRGLVEKAALAETVDPQGMQLIAWRSAGAMLVPLVLPSGELMGLLQLSDSASGAFSDEVLRCCNALAPFGAVALRNATRLALLQRQGLRDRDSGAYTASYFSDLATKEISKAKRYNRVFSLAIFSIDNLASIQLRLGHAAVRAAQTALVRVLSRLIRDADAVTRATEREFYVLLPETDSFGGHMFLRRVMSAIRADVEAKTLESQMSFGLCGALASFPRDGAAFDELVAHCRRRMEDRRASLHHALSLESLPFWDAVELLLGDDLSAPLPEMARESSRRGPFSEKFFNELQQEIARELLRAPRARGLVYLGAPRVNRELPLVRELDLAPAHLGSRVSVLGRRDDFAEHHAVLPVFLDGDQRLLRNEFLLWLGDGVSYAALQRRGSSSHWGFHSSDTVLVESLVEKLQHTYELQPY